MEKINQCPICKSENNHTFLDTADYFLTAEKFPIVECAECKFLFTNPRPSEEMIGPYYDSEDYVSHSKSRKGLVNFVYHLVKSYSLSRKFLLIAKQAKGKRILDIGCATGDFLSVFKKAKWNCMGIEPDDSARTYAIEHNGLDVYPNEKIHDIDNQSLDVVTMWHVLEHVHDLNERIELIKNVLKDDGLFVVAVPNPESYDAVYYDKFWAGYDVPRHLYHFSKSAMQNLVQKHGMKIVQILPMKFDSFYVSMLSEKHKNGQVNYLRSFWIGLLSNLKAVKTSQSNHSSLIYLIKKEAI